jgi:glycosyltransferase involved in cell wall biosynthesis
MSKSVSVVIPTHNRIDSLKNVLCGLEQQKDISFPEFEVIIVSDGSTDETNTYLKDLQSPLNLKPIFQENGGAASARNNGLFAAEGDYVLFIDDDVYPAPTLLCEHLKSHHAATSPAAVLGPMLTPAEFEMSPWVKWEQAMLYKQYSAMRAGKWEPTARQFYTGNTSIGRRYLLDQNGFDTQFRRAEDVELGYRLAEAGIRFIFNENAVGYHHAQRSYQSWLKIPYDYGVNDVIFATEKKQIWLLQSIKREYKKRNIGVRTLTNICLDRPRTSHKVLSFLKKTAQWAHSKNFNALAQKAFSGIFNVRYYQGISDRWGGRDKFYSDIIRN